MRGGAQSQLVAASDGHHYVVKFRNNPQHLRTLANELVASALMRNLWLPVPSVTFVRFDSEFISREPGLRIELAHGSEPVSPGLHFGSRYPVDPDRAAVYDLLPGGILSEVVNRRDFVGALVADKWLANTDSRQAVFFRGTSGRNLPGAPSGGGARGLLVQMIDHGLTFNGQHWTFEDAPGFGLYHDKSVYREIRSWNDFEPWFERLSALDNSTIVQAVHQVPAQWELDTRPLVSLLDRLSARRRQLPGLIEQLRDSVYNPFDNWRRNTLPKIPAQRAMCSRNGGGRKS